VNATALVAGVVVPHRHLRERQPGAAVVLQPRPIPRKQLTAARLAAAITTAVADRDMQARAAALGGKIRAEDDVTRAVEVIER